MTEVADNIRKTLETGKPYTQALETNERVIARITEGIYRQPSSALRELISNAYDADATEVTILTDAPRFSKIIIRDNGQGMDPDVLADLLTNIGASSKKTDYGAEIGVTDKEDSSTSKNGRKLIGRMGIGIFSVAQLTRHFQIITKAKGADFRTVVDIVLNMQADGEETVAGKRKGFKAGHAEIVTERANDIESHGTEILLLDLRKTTRDELASVERWELLEAKDVDEDDIAVVEPLFHIGRISKDQADTLSISPRLPWDESDNPNARFEKLVKAVFDQVKPTATPNLEVIFDKYLQTLWTLSLAAPLEYVDSHPFDLTQTGGMRFFELSNLPRGQATEFSLPSNQTIRNIKDYISPLKSKGDTFSVYFDGVKLMRPLKFKDLPVTENAINTPLLFVGKFEPDLSKVPVELTGGPLSIEAYLLWNPLIVPTQHRGVIVRVGDATGMPFDPHFLDYQVSENSRLKQLTCEIFVIKGLDNAINIDRESFNFAHPHYKLIVKWLHSAIKQFTNRQKAIGKDIRFENKKQTHEQKLQRLKEITIAKIQSRGLQKPVNVSFEDSERLLEFDSLNPEGTLIYSKQAMFGRLGIPVKNVNALFVEEVKAIIQILDAWQVLKTLDHDAQEAFISDLIDVISFENEP